MLHFKKITQLNPQEGNENSSIQRIFPFLDLNEDFVENSSNTTIHSQPSCGYTDKVDYQGMLSSILLICPLIHFCT